MQERSHAFAMKSQIWLLDPRPNLPSIVAAVKQGFELSEASHTPVMLQLRIRACHVHGQFVAGDNRRPAFTLAATRSTSRARDVEPHRAAAGELTCTSRRRSSERWPAAVRFIEEHELNEFFADGRRRHRHRRPGRQLQHAAARARAARPGRRLRPLAGPALRDERRLSGDRRRGAALLRRQARGAAGRGRPAQLHRAEPRDDPAPGRLRRPRCTARTCCRWPASTPRPRC